MDDLLQATVNAEEGRRHSNATIDMKLEAIVIPVSDKRMMSGKARFRAVMTTE